MWLATSMCARPLNDAAKGSRAPSVQLNGPIYTHSGVPHETCVIAYIPLPELSDVAYRVRCVFFFVG